MQVNDLPKNTSFRFGGTAVVSVVRKHDLQTCEDCAAFFARLRCIFAKNEMQSSQKWKQAFYPLIINYL